MVPSGFSLEVIGTAELENFARRKVTLRKSSGRERAWTVRGGSESGTEWFKVSAVLRKADRTWVLSSRGWSVTLI